MNETRTHMHISLRVASVSNDLAPELKARVPELTGMALGHIEAVRGNLGQVLQETGRMLQDRIHEIIVSEMVVSRALPGWNRIPGEVRDRWVQRISYYLRRIAPELVIPPVQSTVQPPFGLWLLGSATGAVVSTAVLQLLNIAPDMAMILTYGTAPLGALAGLLSMRGLLRRFPLLGKLGRTRSVDQLDTGQLRLNIRETTASHLRLTLVLLILLARLIPGESEDETPDSGEIPVNLLHALMKLSRAPEDARTGIAEEVIQEFYNAGYTPDSAEATIIWSEVLREKYDTLGLVNPGDRCRVMEPPVIQGAEIRRKGRVVRDRR